MGAVGGLRLNPGFGCLGLWLALGCSPLKVRIFGAKLYIGGGRQVTGRVFFSHIRVSTWTTWKSK